LCPADIGRRLYHNWLYTVLRSWGKRCLADKNRFWARTYGEDVYPYGKGYITQTAGGGYNILSVGFLQLDSLGNVISTRNYDEYYDKHDYQCANATDDEGYIICGWDVLVKLDSLGNVMWCDSSFFPAMNFVTYVAEGYQGYVYMGATWGAGSDTAPNMDMRIAEWLKLDGYDVWELVIGQPVSNECGYCVQKAGSSKYILAGDPWTLMELDRWGHVMWSREFGGEARYVQETSDGGYIVTGNHNGDLYLLKTDANGDTLSIAEEPITPQGFNWEVLNPVGQQITLRYTDQPQGFHASVFNAAGQKVGELHSASASGTITWGNGMSRGVYFIQEIKRGSGSKVSRVILLH